MQEVYENILKWEVDPRDEDITRLFFKKDGIGDVVNGKRNIIIGRKGSGKTSIAEYIYKTDRKHCRIINLSEFDFIGVKKFRQENKNFGYGYNYFWRHLILFLTVEVYAKNQLFKYKDLQIIKKVIGINYDDDIVRRVSFLENLDFSLNVFGVEAAFSAKTNFLDLSIQEKCSFFKQLIDRCDKKPQISIFFDELDSQFDINNIDLFREYGEVIKSLIITTLEINRSNPSVNSFVMIRDDIFDSITSSFSESNKLIDKAFYLSWDKSELCSLLEHRINSELNNKNFELQNMFNDYSVVSKLMRRKIPQAKVSMLDYFFEHTMLRPRDVVLFIRELVKVCVRFDKKVIDGDVIKKANEIYSIRLEQEIIDEVHSSIDRFSEVIDVLKKKKTANYNSSVLIEDIAYDLKIGFDSAKKIVEKLIYFSVLGIAEGNNLKFRYLDKRVKYIEDAGMEPHPGLRAAIHFTF